MICGLHDQAAWGISPSERDLEIQRAGELFKGGQKNQARELFEDILRRQENSQGVIPTDLVPTLESLAATYESSVADASPASDHAAARKYYLRILQLREDASGGDDAVLVSLLNRIGDTFNKQARHEDSLSYHNRALAIAELKHGVDSPLTAHQINRLADTYRNLGDSSKALDLFERALAIQEKFQGAKALHTVRALEQVAQTQAIMGDAIHAIESYEKTLGLYQELPGNYQEAVAVIWARLGDLYTQTNHFSKAKDLLEKSMAFFLERYGLDCSHLGNIKSMLANVYSAVGDDEKALELDKESVRILLATLGPNHPLTAHRMDNLGLRYDAVGDFKKGRELHERALPVIEKAYGSDHSSTVHVLSNCAEALLRSGETAKAKHHLERILEIRKKVLGPRHPRIAESLCMLAATYGQSGDASKVRELSLEALSIYEETLPANSPRIGRLLNDMAHADMATGDLTNARKKYERALAILDAVYGPQHLQTGITHLWLAEIHYLENRLPLARSHAARAVASFEREMDAALMSDERTRLEMLTEFQDMNFLYCLLRPEQIAQLSLRWKGIVLDSLLEDRAFVRTFSQDREAVGELDELKTLQAELSRIGEGMEFAANRELISSKIGEIQRKMAARTSVFGRVRSSSDLTLDNVLPALTNGGMLVDFLKFQDPKYQGKEALFYGASLLTEHGDPVFVRIPDRDGIDCAIDNVHTALRSGNEELLTLAINILSEKLWRPIAAHIPETIKRLVFCPEGKLNFVSFAALPDDAGAFLCEEFQVSYAATARDPAPVDKATRMQSIAIFANPDFDNSGERSFADRFAMRAAEVSAFGQIRLPALPGSEKESEFLENEARSHGWTTRVFLGRDATEKMIRSLHDVDILHLATHGFYLQPSGAPPEGSRAIHLEPKTQGEAAFAQLNVEINPMKASGIALSGAQATFTSWREGTAPDPENDGILTAEEVACLNLEGTWLVSLSACDTGIGFVRSGEGVFGLRRAFIQAGARNLLMTLWPVRDTITAGVMADFYAQCLSSGDPSRSLSLTQRKWLVTLRKEQGLLAAVRDAGAFVLSSHRPGAGSN